MSTPQALPRAFNLRAWSYFLDFAVMPPVAAGLLWAGGDSAVVCAVAFPVGVIAWTLAEYAIHRFVFHSLAAFSAMHDEHHVRPKAWIGVATWGTALAFGLLWLAACAAAGLAIASAFTAGAIAGYLFYCGIHIRFHHGDPRAFGRYVRFMAQHHNGHHRGGRGNFGVSSPIWDAVFGTYRSSSIKGKSP